MSQTERLKLLLADGKPHRTCSCGCNGLTKKSNFFIHGHNCRGIKLTEDHKKKIGLAHRGKILSTETRKRISLAGKGKVPWNKGTKGVCKSNSGSFKKGIIPWMKGKHIKVNNALEIFIKQNGSWNKGKEIKAIQGKKHWNWQGGKTNTTEKIRKSVKYKQWRDSVFKRDNYTCKECGIHGGKLNADHIMPFSIFSELRFNVENGRTLCVECHRKTETFGFTKQIRTFHEIAKTTNS